MITMSEKDFQDVLTTFGMKQLMRGMSTGLNVAAMAYQDAQSARSSWDSR